MPTEITRERRKKKVRNGFSIEKFQVRSCKMQPAGGVGDFSYGIILSFTMVWCPQITLFIFASFFVAIWSLTFFLLGLDVDPIHTVAHRWKMMNIPNGACNQKHAWNILQSAVCSDLCPCEKRSFCMEWNCVLNS